MKRTLSQNSGNDRVYTPPDLAAGIVAHFKPSGRVLEPCAGKGAFVDAMPGCFSCEIDNGTDFFTVKCKYDWIVTNPPWSQLRPFMKKSMELADNVVFLCLVNAFFMRARQRDIDEAGFGIVEILKVAQPKPPWPQAGFELGAVWLRHGWKGSSWIH